MKNQRRAIHFYDSANPEAIPSGVFAAAYVNGFAWSQHEIDRMHKIFKVSVEREAFWAAKARCIDAESGAALPEDVPPFIRRRREHRFDDGTAYTNRSNRGDIGERLAAAGLEAYEWCATLDGTVDLEPVKGLKLWAIQYQGGMTAAFDLSLLLGVDNFVNP